MRSFVPVPLLLSILAAACGGAPAREPTTPEEESASAEETASPPATLPCVEGEPPPDSPAARLDWMIGTWVTDTVGVSTTERWCAGEGGMLVGDNVTRDAREAVLSHSESTITHSEVLRIEARGGRLVYIASPSGQATTEFTGDARCGSDVIEGNCSRSCEAVFENPEHDFPNTITYGRCMQNDLLVATIAGGERRASWTFHRE